MSVSKKVRFEVFKRDGFQCQYCGATPPKVTLEADHIQPKSKGGEDNTDNLITSCFSCNRGKSNIELSNIPQSISEKSELIQEKENQYKEYKKLLSNVKRRKTREANKINLIFEEFFEDRTLTDKFKKGSVVKFIDKLGYDEVEEAAYSAFSRMRNSGDGVSYFCGICWNKIKNS